MPTDNRQTDNRHSRRTFLSLSGLTAMGLVVAACGGGSSAPAAEAPIESPEEALMRLLEGNVRFVADKSLPIDEGKDRREKVVKRQKPFATIFSCVDSRVPPELIFDRGLGDLFVVRTAGEVPDAAVMGSIEYGAAELEIPLLLVLGHTGCGAVKATVNTMESGETPDADIAYLVEGLKPAVEKAKTKMKASASPAKGAKKATTTTTTAAPTTTTAAAKEGASKDAAAAAAPPDPKAQLIDAAVQAQVELLVEKLIAAPILSEKVKKERLLVVGGIYDLATGKVEVTVGMPEEVTKAMEAKAPKAKDAKAASGETTTTTAKK
jgi:carbonic anhydrase